jgi:hypothetical protein
VKKVHIHFTKSTTSNGAGLRPKIGLEPHERKEKFDAGERLRNGRESAKIEE